MKKILHLFLLAFSFCLVLVGLAFGRHLAQDYLLYNQQTVLSISLDRPLDGQAASQVFEEAAANYQVDFAKYIFPNAQSIQVYSTDPSLGGRLRLAKGHYPQPASPDFVSTLDTGQAQQVGQIRFFDWTTQLSVFPLDRLASLDGYAGLFAVSTLDTALVRELVDFFNQRLGPTDIYARYTGPQPLSLLADTLQAAPMSALALALSGFLFTFLYLYYLLAQAKEMSILSVHGYSFAARAGRLALDQLRVFGLAYLVSGLLIGTSLGWISSLAYVPYFLLLNLAAYLGLLAYSFLVMLAFLGIHKRAYGPQEVLKGQKPFRLLLVLQLILKYVFLALLVFSFTLIHRDRRQLDLEKKGDEAWAQAENVYATNTNFITDDWLEKRPLEQGAKEVFQELEEKVGLFFIRASNYDRLSDGSYLYEVNTQAGTDRYSLAGTSIKVNKNYLDRHPVLEAQSQRPVVDLLVYEDQTLNLLVPLSLKKDQEALVKNFQEGFHLETVEVANLYREEFQQALDPTPPEDLKIHIIYVADGLSYFTYNPAIEKDQGNLVKNPIVLVDTGNLDPSFYYSYLTNSCFFESQALDPASQILPTAIKYDMGASYTSVSSLYSLRAEAIGELETRIQELRLLEVLLVLGFVASVTLFNLAYYEKNRFEIYIKRIFGHSFWDLNKGILLPSTLLTLAALALLPVPLEWKLALFLLDLASSWLISYLVLNSTFAQMIKGGS